MPKRKEPEAPRSPQSTMKTPGRNGDAEPRESEARSSTSGSSNPVFRQIFGGVDLPKLPDFESPKPVSLFGAVSAVDWGLAGFEVQEPATSTKAQVATTSNETETGEGEASEPEQEPEEPTSEQVEETDNPDDLAYEGPCKLFKLTRVDSPSGSAGVKDRKSPTAKPEKSPVSKPLQSPLASPVKSPVAKPEANPLPKGEAQSAASSPRNANPPPTMWRWTDAGQGVCKVLKTDQDSSLRVVVRMKGVQKVLLNVLVNGHSNVEKAGNQSVKFDAAVVDESSDKPSIVSFRINLLSSENQSRFIDLCSSM